MLAVVVTLEAVPGSEEALITALEASASHSRQEPTCHCWEWSRHVSESSRFAIYELYDNAEAFAAHKKSAHFAAWKEATAGLIQSKESGQYDVAGRDER